MRLIDKEELLNHMGAIFVKYPEYQDMYKLIRSDIRRAREVDAIPIEWIKKWCNTQNGKSLEERLLKRYGVLTLLEDWEKENTPSMTHPAV